MLHFFIEQFSVLFGYYFTESYSILSVSDEVKDHSEEIPVSLNEERPVCWCSGEVISHFRAWEDTAERMSWYCELVTTAADVNG